MPGVKPRFFCAKKQKDIDLNQEIVHIYTDMKNNDNVTNTQGSYESTVSFIACNGYGEPEYRVKVTYNNGENVSLLKSYKNFNTASNAAKRELARLTF